MTKSDMMDELLFAYAAGKLDPAVGCVVGTHLALSDANRAAYARYEALGGVLLEGLAPEPVAPRAFDRLMAAIDEAPIMVDDVTPRHCLDDDIPEPLAHLINGRIDELPWGRFGPVSEITLDVPSDGYKLSLLRLRAGRAVPKHTHEGQELTVVLRGGFADGVGHYRRGDLSIADGLIDHQPVADDDEDCYALAVTDAPLRLTGLVGRLFNPLLR